jgi:RNA polymerase sigma factor (sigma-70 family)
MYKKYPKGLKLTPEKEHLVLDNLGIAHKLTQKWFNGVCDIEDIRQQAYLTLVDCATKYDPNSGNKFNTYAYACIDIVLNNYVQNYNKIINIPVNKIYKIYRYLQLPEEEREAYRIQAKITPEDIKFYSTYEIVSMDAQVVDDYDDVSNFYMVEEDGYDRTDDKITINKIVRSLKELVPNEIERLVFIDVINADFDKKLYKDIGKEHGIKLKEVYEIIEKCQKIMQEHKSDFI